MSRILGFARDMVLAQFFGAAAGMDAFVIAFKIPNFMRRLFAEGAFSQAFVPVLAEYQKNKPANEVRLFIARVAGSLGTVLLGVTVVGVIAAPLIVWLFAPGFGDDSSRSLLASGMLRITFPYLMLISLTAMAGAVLNTYGYFAVPAITPVFLNISLIIAAVYFSPQFNVPVVALAWGIFVAGLVQLVFQFPFLLKNGFWIRPQWGFSDAGVKRVLNLMVPALFGVSIAQINLLIDTVFASFLQVGSVTWLYYTDRLTDFPLGVFGVAIATVILPHLSRRVADANQQHFSRSLDWGLRLLLLIGIPSGIGLAIFSMPLIASCFAYGKFAALDVLQTQKSLITLSLGVPAFMMVKILASGFYAYQDIRTPVKAGAWSMLVNTLCCAVFIIPLAHAGLTLASTLAGYVNCAILFTLLKRRGIYTPAADWGRFMWQMLFANSMMGAYLLYSNAPLALWLSKPAVSRLSLLLGHVSVALVIYIISLALVGMRFSQFRGQLEEK
jgi:putative peptidoglycan lipid II flippase